MISVIFLTRRCPRNCDYCNIRNSPLKRELTAKEWLKAFAIIKSLGVEFNLILGNEPWLLGRNLPIIVNSVDIPYAVYTTCMPELFDPLYNELFTMGLNNLSCGIDFPPVVCKNKNEPTYKKSLDGFRGIKATLRDFPEVDCHATITVHKENIEYVPSMIRQFSMFGITIHLNFIHWNKDGGYDFFSDENELRDLLFRTKSDLRMVENIFETIPVLPDSKIFGIEMFSEPMEKLINMKWHCGGDPSGGPTVDADGSLRCCGYRRGKRTPKLSIFDLPEKWVDWKLNVFEDAMDCPGCAWACSWVYNYWKHKDPKNIKPFTQ